MSRCVLVDEDSLKALEAKATDNVIVIEVKISPYDIDTEYGWSEHKIVLDEPIVKKVRNLLNFIKETHWKMMRDDMLELELRNTKLFKDYNESSNKLRDYEFKYNNLSNMSVWQFIKLRKQLRNES